MKKILLLPALMLLLATSSCTPKAQVLKIAEDYATQHICPLLPNAKVPKDGVNVPFSDNGVSIFFKHDVRMIKDLVDQMSIETQKTDALIENMRNYGRFDTSADEHRVALIENALLRAEIDAAKGAVSSKGFYIATIYIQYGDSKHLGCDIILSKDMKILNKPIDMTAIDDIEHQQH